MQVHRLGHSAQPRRQRGRVIITPSHTREVKSPAQTSPSGGTEAEPGSADSGFQVVPTPRHGCPALTSDREGRHLNQIPSSPRSSRASGRMRLHFLKVPQGNMACPPPERGPLSHPPRPTSCAFHTHACWGRKCSDPPPRGRPRSSHTHTHTHTHSHTPQRWLIQQLAFPEILTGVTLMSPEQCFTHTVGDSLISKEWSWWRNPNNVL